MRERPKCAVKNCNNDAFMLFGSKWICGECMSKLIAKEEERKRRMLEELE